MNYSDKIVIKRNMKQKIFYKGKTKTGKDITIRLPEAGDLEQLLKFINDLSDERTFIRYQGEHETLESEKKFVDTRLKDIKDNKAVHLLAFNNDNLIGASEIHLSDKTEKHIGIFGLSVIKDFRGEGIGKLLMDLVIKEAVKKLDNLKIITLVVYSTNDIARNLYKQMGFTEYGKLPNGITRNEKFEDAILMYKNI